MSPIATQMNEYTIDIVINIIGASLSELHTSKIFRRVNHARQKTDQDECQLKYHTSSTKSQKNHSVDY